MAKIKGAILTDLTVVSGHAEQYEAYIKNDLLPTLKKGDVAGYLAAHLLPIRREPLLRFEVPAGVAQVVRASVS